mmetsp:Transcript_6140/g.19240  ORF Transcript_6140/g.19240 Transcript_6140/m.19240 type:complete len:458 (-) Transcript_6140:85-1458(-)
MVRQVVPGRARHARARRSLEQFADLADDDGTALVHEQRRVQQFKGALRGLVDREHYDAVVRRQLAQRRHEAVGGCRVQARRRLVEQQDPRRADHAHRDRDAPPLAARHALHRRRVAAELRVRDVREAERAERFVNRRRPLSRARTDGQRELRGEPDALARRERERQVVLLAHVRDHCWQAHAVLGDRVTADKHAARPRRARREHTRDRIEQRRLARAGRADDAVHLPRHGDAARAAHNLSARRDTHANLVEDETVDARHLVQVGRQHHVRRHAATVFTRAVRRRRGHHAGHHAHRAHAQQQEHAHGAHARREQRDRDCDHARRAGRVQREQRRVDAVGRRALRHDVEGEHLQVDEALRDAVRTGGARAARARLALDGRGPADLEVGHRLPDRSLVNAKGARDIGALSRRRARRELAAGRDAVEHAVVAGLRAVLLVLGRDEQLARRRARQRRARARE